MESTCDESSEYSHCRVSVCKAMPSIPSTYSMICPSAAHTDIMNKKLIIQIIFSKLYRTLSYDHMYGISAPIHRLCRADIT